MSCDRPPPETAPEELVRMHATIEASRHANVVTFMSITEEEREYHKRLSAIWNKVAEFVEGLKS